MKVIDSKKIKQYEIEEEIKLFKCITANKN